MEKRAHSFFAQAAAAALLLASLPANPALAGHDHREAWNKYQEACAVHTTHVAMESMSRSRRSEARFDYDMCMLAETKESPLGTDPFGLILPERCKSAFDEYLSAERDYQAAKDREQASNKECEETHAAYEAALNEYVVEELLTGILLGIPAGLPVDEGIRIQKPPVRTQKPPARPPKPPVRTTQKPPVKVHTEAQTQAAAIIGGMILQGIISGTRKGGGSPAAPSHSHGGGGGSQCSGGSCRR